MDTPKLNKAQETFMQLQKNIHETVISPYREIKVSFNGDLQITELVIANGTEFSHLELLLTESINKCIINVSEKIKNAMLISQQHMQNSNA